jgi:zona occludens toxin
MSIKLYTGRMGSGKTYEVVSVVIVGALSRGRRVVSNIAGLNFEAMKDFISSDGTHGNRIGELVQVRHEDVLDPCFWRSDDDKDKKENGKVSLLPGDLLVLDEVWRFWEGFLASRKMPPPVMNFFRMHRHYVHSETGFTCDIALITQDVMDVSRSVRAVVEEVYVMTKLTAIGSSSRYRIDIYDGSRVNGRYPFRSIQRQYDPKFFVFYSSHSQKEDDGVVANEENIDDRGNIFKGKFFRLVIPLCVVMLVFSVYKVVSFFDVEDKVKASRFSAAPSSSSPSSSSPAPAPAPPAFSRSARSMENNALVSHDVISALFLNSEYRLNYIYNDGRRVNVRIEFVKPTGEVYVFSEDVLYVHGWRLFFAPDNNSLVATNGVDSYVVFQGGIVNRFRRFSHGQGDDRD